MTRQFNLKIRCDCGKEFPAESDFSRWVRSERLLDSAKGFVISDMDFIVHRYVTPDNGRDLQCLMFVEVKEKEADTSLSQRDTLKLVDQLVRNRRQSVHWKPRDQSGNGPLKVRSFILGRNVSCRFLGYHLLQFQNTSPKNSLWIKWDRKTSDVDQLIKLLRMDIDPDTLRPMDFRLHHKKETQILFL